MMDSYLKAYYGLSAEDVNKIKHDSDEQTKK